MVLHADANRLRIADTFTTGIFVRAKIDELWDSVDIAHLTRESLWLWLTSLKPDAARTTVLALLGHDPTDTDSLPREPERT